MSEARERAAWREEAVVDVPLADPLWKATVDALALLRRAGLPPTPLTFGFAHAIVTGATPRAARALEEAHAQGRALGEAQCVRLFREEAGAGALELAPAIGHRIDAQIRRLIEAIAHQRAATDRFATAVAGRLSGLDESADARTLATALLALLEESSAIITQSRFLDRSFDAARESLDALSRELATAKEASLRDALTGAASRGAYEHHATLAFARWRPLALLLVDVDGLARVNDRHGVALGDHVLRLVASVLRGAVREEDLIARLEADTFVVLLAEASGFVAEIAAGVVCETLARRPIVKRGTGEAIDPVTVSIGIATRLPDDTPEALEARAGAALARARSDGGNRFVVA